MSEEQRELTSDELVSIANQLNAQVNQLNLVVKDLSEKLGKKEVETSQLRAIITTMTGQPKADDGSLEEE
jgi:hypothetical protein|tara:strand:+ start:267 stop:476 length:210 start_codon:yes stop_codon:yes gene_type:complete